MPVYEWTGRTPTGEIQKGVIEAPDERVVRLHLVREKIVPVEIKPKTEKSWGIFRFKRVKPKEIAIFTRQLSTMLEAGLPLVQALDSLALQQENPYFREIVINIKNNIEGGSSLAETLKQYPKIFDSLYCHMVDAGEASGNLDETLSRLANYMERALALKAKVKKALIYPGVILFVTTVVLSIIMIFVIPTFEKLFSEMGQSLPLPTQIVIHMSRLIKRYFLVFIGCIVFSIFLIRRYYRTTKGRYHIDALLLKMPIFGILFRKVAVARFARTLGTLIASGVSILDALKIAAKTAGNVVVENAITQTRKSIQEGQSIAEPLAESGIFPHMVIQMVAVGESTGVLEKMLHKVADFYEEEVDILVESLAQMIEPILIVFLGIVIGGIIISLYLPIFKMGEVIGR